jgi:hypothetical protein
MAFTGPAEDRLAIRELYDAYSDACVLGDDEAWGALWTEDAYWSLPEFEGHEEFVGRDAIVKGWRWSMDLYGPLRGENGRACMIYVGTPGAIAVDGDRATARCYTSEITKWPGHDTETRTRGRYDDELIKQDGRWMFQKRTYRTLHNAQ